MRDHSAAAPNSAMRRNNAQYAAAPSAASRSRLGSFFLQPLSSIRAPFFEKTRIVPVRTGTQTTRKPGLSISTSLAQQLARDDHALDFACPLVNRNHARVAVHALHIRLPRIPHASMHLHRLIHY